MLDSIKSLDFWLDIGLDSLLDSLKLLPFLFLTYILMEWIERKGEVALTRSITNVNKIGPLLGGLFGVVPQCGFSAGAASLYSGRVITLGTLLAVFFSTSDEMLPLLVTDGLAHKEISVASIFIIIGIKVAIAIISGYLVEVVAHVILHKKKDRVAIRVVCDEEHCKCEDGIWKSTIKHTLKIFLYLVIISFALNLVINLVGTENLANIFTGVPVLGQVIGAIVGLIPNCAVSIAMTKMYLEGIITPGIMMSGLLVNAGTGLLVLFRLNRKPKQNLGIIGIMVVLGIFWGVILDLIVKTTGLLL